MDPPRRQTLAQRLWSSRSLPPVPNSTCPNCNRPVKVGSSYGGDNFAGPLYTPPAVEERRAACIDCGRRPFNYATIEALTGERPRSRRDDADIRFERRGVLAIVGLWVFIIIAVVAVLIATR